MKKTISIILALTMTLTLCACGAKPAPAPVSSPPASASASAPATDLTKCLRAVETDYQQGVAGCSLNAVKLAGGMMDWYASAKPSADGVTAEAAAFFKTLGADTADFTSKIADICAAAMQSCGSGGADLMASAGYTPTGKWTFADAKTLFGAVYAGMQLPLPTYIAVYSGDGQAERFLINYVSVDELTADNVLAALTNSGAVDQGVQVKNFSSKGETLTLDLNSAFQTQLSSLGTAGEYILMGSVVNTFLAAFGAESITVTANGKTIETGHNEYSEPLTEYPDNTAANG